MSIQTALAEYIKEPSYAPLNIDLAYAYKREKQYAAAISFFLRAANFAESKSAQYEAMLQVAYCYKQLPDRTDTVRAALYHCLTIDSKRPEAYFLLAELFEHNKRWHEAYFWAVHGLEMADFTLTIIRDVGYGGRYSLAYEQAITSWWCDKPEESKNLLQELIQVPGMDRAHMLSVLNNSRYGPIQYVDEHNTYTKELHGKLIRKFDGSEKIARNYSQVYQDMFALTVAMGTKKLKYLEIGAGDPVYYNNTNLLESKFGWTGISIDRDPKVLDQWPVIRPKANILCADALKVDFEKLLKDFSDEREYGYLQVDCEPAENTFKALVSIPFDQFKFAAVTFEHDWYDTNDKTYRDLARKFMKSIGYVLAVPDVSVLGVIAPFEDWYVHPDLVSKEFIDKFTPKTPEGTDVRKLFLY